MCWQWFQEVGGPKPGATPTAPRQRFFTVGSSDVIPLASIVGRGQFITISACAGLPGPYCLNDTDPGVVVGSGSVLAAHAMEPGAACGAGHAVPVSGSWPCWWRGRGTCCAWMRARDTRCLRAGTACCLVRADASAKRLDATADLFPCVRVHIVNVETGTEVHPTRCNRDSGTSVGHSASSCVFVKGGVQSPTKLAWLPTGPVCVTYQKFECRRHKGGLFVCKPSFRHLLDDDNQLEPCFLKLGEVGGGATRSYDFAPHIFMVYLLTPHIFMVYFLAKGPISV